MEIGCFALIQPFSGMATQFQLIREMGIKNADVTDNHDGASLGAEVPFVATVSLDSHPSRIRKMAEEAGVNLTTFCAHGNLLDPPSPDNYGTFQIIKAIRMAKDLGLKHVITTEGDPKTEFGENLTHEQKIFAICEKLYWPVLWAEELGISLLLETHGPITDSVDSMEELLNRLGHPESLGICLDTGNSWLGGAEPIDYIKRLGNRIGHVHWKDMAAEWEPKRGTLWGCGMATIPLGDGVINLPEIVEGLKGIGYDGHTTLEVAGSNNVKTSAERLMGWIAG